MHNHTKAGLFGMGLALSLGPAASSWAAQAPADQGQELQLGVLFYGDYNYYTKTGYAPQFLTQQIHPATGSDYNSFEVTRTYLDFHYTPVPTWTLRVTPNLNRDSTGNLYVRIKYAYLDKKGLFDSVATMKGGVVTAGQEPNPLVGWEEDMWGYRFVNLVPWNYVGLSSTYDGVSLHGPIKFHGRQYIDYDVGVFTNSSFHTYEQVNAKQFMARVSYYPLGASSRFAGLGLTGFVDNGWSGNTTTHHNLQRMAFLAHYNAPTWGIAGEYDKGRDAVGTGNMISGLSNGAGNLFNDPNYAAVNTAYNNVFSGGSRQSGYAVFGHYDVPAGLMGAGWSVFGIYQHFEPNTENKLLNFDRYTAGVGYQANSAVSFALDYQDFHYTEKSQLAQVVPASAASDTQAVFLNVQFKDSKTFHMHGL